MKLHFDFEKRVGKNRILEFCDYINKINNLVDFKMSARGWGYILEQEGFITKDQFDKVESLINRCRKEGYLPVDFVAEESSRQFKCIHTPTESSDDEFIRSWLESAFHCERYYEPDWWVGENCYIQMVVEKVDLVSLFEPICEKYHIPIANSKGWSSISQRAEYSRRFKEAEDKGLECVLLYCGDFDPDGVRISDTMRKNLEDVKDIRWEDGEVGYDPKYLTIKRFGLNYDLIESLGLSWIDNLITGSGKNLANPNHKNFKLTYVQEYLKDIGERKCEANAIVIRPDDARKLCEDTIKSYVGDDALDRFNDKRKEVRARLVERMTSIGIYKPLRDSINLLN